MGWETYHKWCLEKGLPVLARPAGIKVMGDHVYNDEDGILYVNRKPVGKFLTVCRYTGLDILLKPQNIDNPKRFARLRWRILEHVTELYRAQSDVLDAIEAELYEGKRLPKQFSVLAMHEASLMSLTIYNRDYEGRSASPGPADYETDRRDPLTRLSKMPRGPESVLAEEWFRLRDRIDRYSAIATNLGHCLGAILHQMHPDRKAGRPRYLNRPVIFDIDGRLYPISAHSNSSSDRSYWPEPSFPPVQVL